MLSYNTKCKLFQCSWRSAELAQQDPTKRGRLSESDKRKDQPPAPAPAPVPAPAPAPAPK